MSVLTPEQVDAIVACRKILVELEREVATAPVNVSSDNLYEGFHESRNRGRLAQTVNTAAEALFDTLNLANSHLHCSEARRGLDAMLKPAE